MQFTIEVETSGPMLAFDLFGRPSNLTTGTKVSLPGGAVLELHSMREQRVLDLPTLLKLGLTAGSSVAGSLAANWLYDKLKGRARSLRIDRMEVQIEKGQIEKLLIERIEKKD